MQEYPFVFWGGVTIIFGVGVWIFAVSFFSVSRVLSPGCSVFSGRRRQLVGPAVSVWSLGSQKKQRPSEPKTQHQLPTEHLRLTCLCQWFRWSVLLSLCFSILRPAAALFLASWRSLQLNWSFHQLAAFPECGFLFPPQLPLRNASPILIHFLSLSLFFSFVLPSYVKSFFCWNSVDVLCESFYM